MSVHTTAKPTPPESRPPARTSAGEDLVTVLLGGWMTLGGFVDGFAHRNLDTPETFFTPWHGVLYSGFLASAAWLVWLVIRNRSGAGSFMLAIPDGYGTSLAGVLVFLAGGLGDMFWHLAFGIEVSIDALLSPTHILLLIGALLILSGPFRSGWRDHAYHPTRLRQFWPPLLAVTLMASQLGFFFQYLDGFSTRLMEVRYIPGLEEGVLQAAAGISSILITNLVVMGPLVLIMRRWRLPVGSGVVFFWVIGTLMEWLEGFAYLEDLAAPLAAGVIADFLLLVLRPGQERVSAFRTFLFGVPFAMWAVRFAVFEAVSVIRWPVEIWSGTMIFAGLTGVGLSLLAVPPSNRAVEQV